MMLTAQTLVVVLVQKCRTEMKWEAYVRPMEKIPVSTSFCCWLVFKRQSIGIG